MDVDLALVIGGAAAKEIAVADGGFERRSSPKVERFCGLDIIVAVEENGRLAGSFKRFGIHERVEICGNNFDFLETSGAKIVRDPASCAFDIRFVLALGADAGNPQKIAQLRQMSIAMTFYKFSKVRHGALGGYESFQIK